MRMYPSKSIVSVCLSAVLAAILHSCSLSKDAPVDFFSYLFSIDVNTSSHGASFSSGNNPYKAFIYNDDENALLDCHQDAIPKNGFLQLSSTSGRKKAVVVQGFDTDGLGYSSIASYSSMCEVCSSIFDEKLSSRDGAGAVMCGECSFEAGPQRRYNLTLTPLLCRVHLESLEVDFSGRPYRDKKLEDIKVYLTNVRALCPLVDCDHRGAQEILNYAGWDASLPSRMKNIGLIRSDEPHDGLDLYCYPHEAGSIGELGNPPTRLVIEGRIDGNTVYYPITIADGVMKRGVCYSYRIVITRSGGPDPDSPVETETVNFEYEILPWSEKENRYEEY